MNLKPRGVQETLSAEAVKQRVHALEGGARHLGVHVNGPGGDARDPAAGVAGARVGVGGQSVALRLRYLLGVRNWRAALRTRRGAAGHYTALHPFSPTRVALHAMATRQADNSTPVREAYGTGLRVVLTIVGCVFFFFSR